MVSCAKVSTTLEPETPRGSFWESEADLPQSTRDIAGKAVHSPFSCLVQFRVAIVDVLVQGPQALGLSYKNPGQGSGWSAKLGHVRGPADWGQKGRLRKCHSRSGPKVTEGADTVLATTGSTGVPRLLRFLAFLCCLAVGEGSL